MNGTNRFGSPSNGNAKVANGKCDMTSNRTKNHDEENDNDVGNRSNRNPQSFLKEGNRLFIYKNFPGAISTYTHGLDLFKEALLCGDDDPVVVVENEPDKSRCVSGNTNESKTVVLELFSNRALAYLSIGNYTAALEDAEKALSINPTHFKAIFRKTKALAGLAQYQNAIGFGESSLKRLTKKNKQESVSDFKELAAYLEKLRRMKHQSETGDYYDMPSIMERPFESTPPDWVDYIGAVKVEKILGKGRGLVAAEDLPPAKLILACRAFEVIFLDTGSPDPEESLSLESKDALENGNFKVEDDKTLNFLARKIYDRLIRNPEKRVDFYQLHAGNDLGYVEIPPESKEIPELDMERIYGICKTNTFANSGDSYPEVEKSVGLWLFPAFVNHLCIGGNCTWKIFGDYIFVRTFKPVKKGEELVHSYVSPAYPYRARFGTLTERLGFVCPCILCDLDRQLPKSIHDEKEKLKQLVLNQEVDFSSLEQNVDSSEYAKKFQASTMILEQIILKLEKIQPKHGKYNASLLDPLQKLGLKYFSVGDFEKAARIMERVCSLMNACMLPHGVVDCSMWIVGSYMQLGNAKQAKKWAKILVENVMLAYGDIQALKVVGDWLLEPLAQWGLI
ncbi:unnamed protein product [Orchesella dallaii]|uniref:SET domain-containing protein n=1 Tax=Orchesella dallaii TaxID=48710 RepID=A0ABP1S5U1_9HEXA